MSGNDLRAIAAYGRRAQLAPSHVSALLDAADQMDALRAALALSEQQKRKAYEELEAVRRG